MMHVIEPAVWLIVLVVGLPQLSETVYTPSLPEIARALRASEAMVEHTLTIYLLSFALGTLFWGWVSDRIGRKPCILVGLGIFILGCIGCYSSETLSLLMTSRFVQAFGGSIGSVLGQSLCRDAFQGSDLGRVYSTIGSALALFPALGPVIGGLIAEWYGWSNIFLFLIAFALLIGTCVFFLLPETHPSHKRTPTSLGPLAYALLTDKRVMGCAFLVGGVNGINFSYFAEGSFCLISILGLSPSLYGASFIAIAASSALGGLYSRMLHARQVTGEAIIRLGLQILLGATTFGALCATVFFFRGGGVIAQHAFLLRGIILVTQMITMFGVCMITSNALALALVDYKKAIGSATSLFGFFYYCFISLFTFGMGALHNGTLLPMPLYFCGIVLSMLVVERFTLRQNRAH